MAILPPATIGILGGGQLGRMTALAARSMGYGVQVLDPSADCAAAAVADRVVVGAFDDAAAAADLARECDVITIEIEQISAEALEAAQRFAPVRPGADVLRMVQDRGRQKHWLSSQGVPIGAYESVTSGEALGEAMRTLGASIFLKACQGGYDGRSQLRISSGDNPSAAFASLGGRPAVAEQALALALELSVLVARRPSGETTVFPIAINHHERQVLAWSVTPGALDDSLARQADEIARHIADALSLEGILAVEMFLLEDGRLLVNELAPRPHNSFHATELACPTSQFEQLVRTVCDLPLGDVRPVRPAAIVNLFGDSWANGAVPRFDRALAVPGTRLFLYGKKGARAGRKMGHIAAVGETTDEALARATRAFAAL
ncbi:MAG: 5-(carboxyamino)imidazole ribonucleotide synthase [Gemmatimonadota bacterium]|nr:5-(carboxyamino)imidazole ribonucleotide synthase [Gemmatimonadota bacterium]